MKNKIRFYIQLIFLILILYVAIRPAFDKSYIADFEQYCPFGGISSFFSKLNLGSMSCNMSETQVFLGIALLLGAGLIGKLFCGFVCPIGSVSEWLGKLGDKLKIRKEIPKKLDTYLRILKYVLLFITIYFTMTSSELFCKKFDPYYASVHLFSDNDIVLLFAIPAFILTIAGAIFFRLFWCKYLCPLGAMTNVFMNIIPAGLVILLFVILNYFGAGLNYIWLLGGLVLSGLLNEIIFKKSFISPFAKIRKNNDCTNCGFCDLKCPQGIKISSGTTVNHIDCNLCTDCIYNCPRKNVLTINNRPKLKYLSPIVLVILIIISLGAANYYEFNTISLRWGTSEGKEALYVYSGLKSIKCYGSSMSLAGTLKSVDGIIGLDTYAKSHTVKVYYNPDIISEEKVKEALFKPAKRIISEPENVYTDSVSIYEVGIYGLFDQVDFSNLYSIFKSNKGFYRIETHFGEPVKATIFFNPKIVSISDIKRIIESKITIIKNNGIEEKIETNFKLENNGIVKEVISALEYKKMIFRPIEEDFVDLENYNKENIYVYQYYLPEAENPAMREKFDYLISYLSGFDGILKFKTEFIDKPYALIYYDVKVIDSDKIKNILQSKKLKFYITETETQEIENPFKLLSEGNIYKLNKLIHNNH